MSISPSIMHIHVVVILLMTYLHLSACNAVRIESSIVFSLISLDNDRTYSLDSDKKESGWKSYLVTNM